MVPYSIYIVDDEPSILDAISLAFGDEYNIQVFGSAEESLAALCESPPDLVLLDVGLPGIDGIQALGRIKQFQQDLPVIMITAYEDIKTVISAMKMGAYDYVVKPLHMESLQVTIKNALETVRLRKEVQELQEKYLKENLPCFISESESLQDVMVYIRMVANSPDTPILILGETGTGKELIASAIHFRSPNFKGPLITVNCAAIPKDLVESELFGYEKGAFSGASTSGKKGLIEEAAGGTLFLDEIGDLSEAAQAKLLRFLEEGEFYRVGSTKKLKVKTRVVSATNKDLDKLIAHDQFRKDLYFRLGVVKVRLPSLNERRGDVMPLAKYFLNEFNKKFGKSLRGISKEGEAALLSHSWTGNVRELKNRIETAVLISTGQELAVQDLNLEESPKASEHPAGNRPGLPPLTAAGLDLDQVRDRVEIFYINEALKLTAGNESKAARLLAMNHHTFRYRRKKLLNE